MNLIKFLRAGLKWLGILMLTLFLLSLQTVYAETLSLFRMPPEFLPGLAAMVAAWEGTRAGAIFGGTAGLFLTVSGELAGLFALYYFLSGMLIGWLFSHHLHRQFFTIWGIALLCALGAAGYRILPELMQGSTFSWTVLLQHCGGYVLSALLCTPVLYPPLRGLHLLGKGPTRHIRGRLPL